MKADQNPNLVPFLVACLGVAVFATMDAVMKGLAMVIGAYSAVFWRQVVGVLLSGPAFLLFKQGWPDLQALKVHALRGGQGSIMAFIFFWGLARFPLAEGTAITFIAPLIALYLAALLLNEEIGRNTVAASVMGLLGVGVILGGRIGAGALGDEALQGFGAMILSAILYAYNLILQRQQALLSTAVEAAFFTNLFAVITLAIAAPFIAVIPAAGDWWVVALSSALAFTALVLLSWAYRRAEAQILIPVEYSAFIWASLFGWWLFEEQLTLWTVGGTVLIVAGCFIAAKGKGAAPEI